MLPFELALKLPFSAEGPFAMRHALFRCSEVICNMQYAARC